MERRDNRRARRSTWFKVHLILVDVSARDEEPTNEACTALTEESESIGDVQQQADEVQLQDTSTDVAVKSESIGDLQQQSGEPQLQGTGTNAVFNGNQRVERNRFYSFITFMMACLAFVTRVFLPLYWKFGNTRSV